MSGPNRLDPIGDPFGPPTISTLVGCIHCGQEYDSYRIEWRIEQTRSGQQGFWCCPIPGCDGRGVGFDILPVDPNDRDERGGWVHDDELVDEDFDDVDDIYSSEATGNLPADDDTLPF